MSRERVRPGRRFRLMLYDRLYDLLYWPLLLLLLALAVLWWYAPFIMFLAPYDYVVLFVGGLCLALFGLTYGGRFVSYVQCRSDHLRIQTLLFRLAVSYQRIQTVRPVKFGEQHPLAKQRWSQRRFVAPLLGLVGVAVTVRAYPIPLRWLRVWLNDYMFTRDAPGFLFLVDDWMSLSREIDDYRDRWRERRARAARPRVISMNPFLER